MKKHATILTLTIGILLGTSTPSKAAYPVTVLADVPQVIDTLMHKAAWAIDYVEQVNQVVELVTNNKITQTISDVMGTVNTLSNAPGQILGDLQDSLGGIYGLFDTKSWLGSFEGMYNNMTSGLKNLSLSQIGDPGANNNYIKNNGGLFGFMNQIGGMRTALNTAYLEDSKSRENKLQNWSKAKYGDDQAQMMSTQTDLMTEMVKQSYRAEEMRALDRVYESTERAAYEEQLRAKAHKADIQTESWFDGQLKF